MIPTSVGLKMYAGAFTHKMKIKNNKEPRKHTPDQPEASTWI
jgi:hypothetical protein